jgi:hypothetical protein
LNIVFEPSMPMKPIVIPGVGEATAAGAIGQAAARTPLSMARNVAMAHVGAQATVESAGLQAGRAAAQSNMAAQRAEGQVQKTENAAQQAGQNQMMQQGMQQGMQMGMQLASQLGSTLGQLPQQATQMVSQPMQQLTAPLQQVTSMFGQFGSMGGDKAQMGLIGASPLSNHPLAGGAGAASGAGLVRAASLPGAGGTGARTPLMANLIGETKPVAVAPGAAAGANAAGLAPVGAGGGMGPMGGMGQRATSGGSKQGLRAPSVLPQDLGEDEDDEW